MNELDRASYAVATLDWIDFRPIMVGSLITDIDTAPDGSWAATSVFAGKLHVVVDGSPIETLAPPIPSLVRLLPTGDVLVITPASGQAWVVTRAGVTTATFALGADIHDVIVTRDRFFVTYHDDDSGHLDHALTMQTANVFDLGGRHLWGYMDKFGDRLPWRPIACPADGEVCVLAGEELLHINTSAGTRRAVEAVPELKSAFGLSFRRGAYYFCIGLGSPASYTDFVWSSGHSAPLRLPNTQISILDRRKRGLANGDQLSFDPNGLAFVQTPPQTSLEH